MSAPLFAFLHHIAAFAVFAALFSQLILLKHNPTAALARSLARIDAIYGLSALTLIAFGAVRVHFTEKGAAFYLHNGAFIAKIGLFIIVGLISIYPTRRFMAWRREANAGREPQVDESTRARIRRAVHLELGLLVFVILCAVLMARGITQFG